MWGKAGENAKKFFVLLKKSEKDEKNKEKMMLINMAIGNRKTKLEKKV